jgi:hypothetical protein
VGAVSATSPPTGGLQPPQRVCPRCSTISRTVEPQCPFCGRSYTRRGPWAAIAAATLLTIAATLAGVALMLTAFGGTLEDELDEQVTTVERDLDRQVGRLERRIVRELDTRFPTAPGAAPGG